MSTPLPSGRPLSSLTRVSELAPHSILSPHSMSSLKKQVRAPASNFAGASPCTLDDPDFFPGYLRCHVSWIPTLHHHLRLFSPCARALLQTFEQIQFSTTLGLQEFSRTTGANYHKLGGASQDRHLFSEFWGKNSELKYLQSSVLQRINCSLGNAPQLQEPFPASCPQNQISIIRYFL